MTRNEFFLACFLVFLILAGIAYRDRVGGGGAIQPVLITGKAHENPTGLAPVEIPPVTAMVNINRAGTEDLIAVPGLDSKCAENIVSFRERYGPFSDLRELMEVSGIDRARYEKLRPYVRLADLKAIEIPTPQPTWGQVSRKNVRASGPVIGDGGKATLRAPAVRYPKARVFRLQPRANPGLRDLNRATLTDLKAVSGIGDVFAQRILEARTRSRGFKSWQQVRRVEGIGDARLGTLQKHFFIR